MENQKIALVTGGNKGIGLETVKQLAKEGVKVYLGARSQERGEQAIAQLAAEGVEATFIHLDIEDQATFEATHSLLEKEHGRLDILVNNAGVQIEDPTWSSNTAVNISADHLRRTFEINLFGLIELTNALLPLLKKSEAGRIVNLSSILASLTLHADPTSDIYNSKAFAYNASKAALNMYTLHLAHALQGTKIQTNSAHPGWVKTDMGTEAAPMQVTDGARTSVELALTTDESINGKYIHLGEELPW